MTLVWQPFPKDSTSSKGSACIVLKSTVSPEHMPASWYGAWTLSWKGKVWVGPSVASFLHPFFCLLKGPLERNFCYWKLHNSLFYFRVFSFFYIVNTVNSLWYVLMKSLDHSNPNSFIADVEFTFWSVCNISEGVRQLVLMWFRKASSQLCCSAVIPKHD